jgi:hypothetical protein
MGGSREAPLADVGERRAMDKRVSRIVFVLAIIAGFIAICYAVVVWS